MGGNYGNAVDIVVLKAVCCSPGFIIFVKVSSISFVGVKMQIKVHNIKVK